MREKYIMSANTKDEIKKLEKLMQEIHLINVKLHQDVDYAIEELEYVQERLVTPSVNPDYDINHPEKSTLLDHNEFKKDIGNFLADIDMKKLNCEHEELLLNMQDKLEEYNSVKKNKYYYQFIVSPNVNMRNAFVSDRRMIATSEKVAKKMLIEIYESEELYDIQLLKVA